MRLSLKVFLSLILLLPLLAGTPAIGGDYTDLPLERVEQLALQGDVRAQVELAEALEHGEGVKRNIDSALVWYCRAASRGSSDAQRSLGWIYANGKGVTRDDEIAAYWLDKAADAGDDYAARLVKRIVDDVVTPRRTGCNHVAKAPWLKKRCTSADCRQIVQLVERLSFDYQLDADLVLAVISAESGFNPRAHSNKGARGLMQLIPETASRFGVHDSWNREQNIRGGMAYLRWLLAYFDGNVKHALAGYNAGEHRVVRFKGVPPFAETRAYVKKIIADYGKQQHHFDKRWLKRSKPARGAIAQRRGDATKRLDG